MAVTAAAPVWLVGRWRCLVGGRGVAHLIGSVVDEGHVRLACDDLWDVPVYLGWLAEGVGAARCPACSGGEPGALIGELAGRPRLSGHALLRGLDGSRRAMCECGERSLPLPSCTARRMWHRRHKSLVSGPDA